MNKSRHDQERCQGREGDRTPAPYKCYASEGAGKYARRSRALGGEDGENGGSL
jgi:hypothetical protein